MNPGELVATGPAARAPMFVAAAVLALSLVTALIGVAVVVVVHEPIPFEDFLDFLRRFREAGGWAGYGVEQFQARHNEHRLVVPRLWFLLDLWAVDGRQTLLVTVNVASMVVLAWLLARLTLALGCGWRVAAIFGLVAMAGMLSPVQAKNLVWGFQVQFIQVWLFALAACALVGLARPGGETRGDFPVAIATVGAIACGLASTYTMANGLLVWPALICLALWRRLPSPATGAILVVGTAVMAIEVAGFEPHPGHGDPADTIARPAALARYALRYLTSAVSTIGTLGQELLGAALIAFLGATAALALRRRERVTAAQGALLAFAGFIVASALVTALGRVNLGIGQANSMRYATPSMLFLLTCAALALPHVVGVWRPATRAWAILVGVALLLVPGLVDGINNAGWLVAERDARVIAVTTYLSGDDRPEAYRPLYPPSPAVARETLEWLDRENLGPFSMRARYVGRGAATE